MQGYVLHVSQSLLLNSEFSVMDTFTSGMNSEGVREKEGGKGREGRREGGGEGAGRRGTVSIAALQACTVTPL